MNRLLCLCLTSTLLLPAMLFFQLLAPAFAPSTAPKTQTFVATDAEGRATRAPHRLADAAESDRRTNEEAGRVRASVELALETVRHQAATESGRRK